MSVLRIVIIYAQLMALTFILGAFNNIPYRVIRRVSDKVRHGHKLCRHRANREAVEMVNLAAFAEK